MALAPRAARGLKEWAGSMETTTTQAAPPARLHAVLARAAPVGVVLRRGPSRWVQCIRWDTRKDTFAPGQWFHGRIYEDRCELSPDGELLVYFAGKQTARSRQGGYDGTWTAVSKPPYLTALALWPQGDTWEGGGYFLDARTLELHSEREPHPDHLPPPALRVVRPAGNIVLARITGERQGWTLEGDARYAGRPVSWTKREQAGDSLLVRRRSGQQEWYELLRPRLDDEQMIDQATWADWDQQGRLVFARQGCLYTADVRAPGELAPRLLADFNAARPMPVAPPKWATRW